MAKRCDLNNPAEAAKFYDEVARREVQNATRESPFKLEAPPSNSIAYAYDRTKRWINTQRKAHSQVTEGKHGGFLGDFVSMEDLYALVKDPDARAKFEQRVTDLRVMKAEGASALIHRENQVNMKEAAKLIRKIAKETGQSIADINAKIYDLRTNTPEKIAEIQDPLLKQVMDIFDKDHTYMTEIVLQDPNLTPELRQTILDTEGRHLMRQYAIHRNNKNVLQELEKTSSDYVSLFKDMKEGEDYARFREGIVSSWRPKIEAGFPELSEEGVTAMLDQIVDNRINGEISRVVKQTLNNPDARWLKSAIVQSKGQYLVRRLIKDPRVRALMGEETHASLAAANLAGKVAHDVKAAIIRKGLYEAMQEAGMVSDSALPQLDRAINKRTFRPFQHGDDVTDGVFYTNAAAQNLLQSVSEGQTMGALSRVVSLVKLGKIFTPKLWANNLVGAMQSAAMGGGIFRSMRHPIESLQDAAVAAQLSRELAFPTTGGLSKDANAMLTKMGFKNVDELRTLAKDFVSRGLDIGGEYHTAGVEGIKSAIKGDPGVSGALGKKVSSKVKQGSLTALELYRIPDIATKVYVYRRMVDEIAYKEGVRISEMSEELLNRAAKDTLKLTQDPRTTAAFVKNMSRGPVGVVLGGFQGFFYQMARNTANAVHMAYKDAATAARLRAVDPRKAKRYALAATDRLASTALAGYALFEGLESAYTALEGHTEEQVTSLKRFLNPQDRNSTVWMGKMEKGKDGNTYVEVVKPASIDVYDGVMQVVRSLLKNGPENPMQVALETKDAIMGQFLAPGLVLEAINNLRNKHLEVNPNFLEGGDNAIWPWEEKSVKTASAVRTAAPSIINDFVNYFKALNEMNEPESNKTYERAKSRMFALQSKVGAVGELLPGMNPTPAQYTMASAQRLNLSQAVRNAFTDEYRKEGWISDFKKDWSKARTIQQKTDLLKGKEKDWDKLMKRLLDLSHAAQGTGLSRQEVYRIIKDKDGYLGMPKDIARDIALGRVTSFRKFAYGLRIEQDRD